MDYLEFLKIQNVPVYGEIKAHLFTDGDSVWDSEDKPLSLDQPDKSTDDKSPLQYDAPPYFESGMKHWLMGRWWALGG